MSVIVFVSDLFFREKIAAASKELGVPVFFARSLARGREILSTHPCHTAIIDLHLKGENGVELGKLLKAEGLVKEVYGYYSHVEVETGDAAEVAGFDGVMPRSAFFLDLPTILDPSMSK